MTLRIIWVIFCVLSLITAFGPIRCLKLPLKWRLLLGFFAFSSAQGYVLQKLFDASVMCPDKLPFPLLVLAKWGDIATLMTGIFALIWILLRLLRIKCPPVIPLFLGMILGGVMLGLGVCQPPLRTSTLHLPNLPPEAEGLKIAIVADIHIDCWRGEAWCKRLVERINAERPDIILLTGDQIDGEFERRRADLRPLAALEAPLGKFVISGNHEFMNEVDDYLRYYQTLGMTLLDGKATTVRGMTIMGLPDGYSLIKNENADILRQLATQVSADTFSILMVHKPALATLADELGIDVQFSGHTHGGQFPGLATLMKRFNNGFVRGWYTLPNGLKLFVSPGAAAWIGFPYRLYRSELSIFTLTRHAPEA